jgi:hypothetical protein
MLKVKREGYEIVRAGVYDERIIERLLRTTILFVCSATPAARRWPRRSPARDGEES